MDDAPRIRLLLVEDDPLVRDALYRHLSDEFAVDCAADGRAALERLRVPPPYDAHILDWRLPDVSGLEVLRWASAAEPGALRRTILLTGTYYESDIDPQWPVARLLKPVSPVLLGLLVRRIVAGHSAAEAAADLV